MNLGMEDDVDADELAAELAEAERSDEEEDAPELVEGPDDPVAVDKICLLRGKQIVNPKPGEVAVLWEDGSADYAPQGGLVKGSAPAGTFKYPPPASNLLLLDVNKTVPCPPPPPPILMGVPVKQGTTPPPLTAGQEDAGEAKGEMLPVSRREKVLFALAAAAVGGALLYGLHRRSVTRAEDRALGAGYRHGEQAGRASAEHQARAAAQEWIQAQRSAA